MTSMTTKITKRAAPFTEGHIVLSISPNAKGTSYVVKRVRWSSSVNDFYVHGTRGESMLAKFLVLG